MYDDDRASTASSISDTIANDTLYAPSRPRSPHLASDRALCVCALSVELLHEEHRWVGNADSLYDPVGGCLSFHDEVDNDFFPFTLGGKCVEVGEGQLDEDNEVNGVDVEYSAEERNVRCVACHDAGTPAVTVKMYQSVLCFEDSRNGHTRPRLAWFIDFNEMDQTYCCVLWRADSRRTEAEQGAVFGLWGADGAHSQLTFRVVSDDDRTVQADFPCLGSQTTEQLAQLLISHEVYFGNTTNAERDLRQQLERRGRPLWESYARWKFPAGVESSPGAVHACCAACYDAPPAQRRCQIFRLSKLALKPCWNHELRLLAYKIGGRSRNARYVFFGKRRSDDTLRFLKMDGTYTNLAVRLLRGCPSVAQIERSRTTHCCRNESATNKRRRYELRATTLIKDAEPVNLSFAAINEAERSPKTAQVLQEKTPSITKTFEREPNGTFPATASSTSSKEIVGTKDGQLNSDDLTLEEDEGAVHLLAIAGQTRGPGSDSSSSQNLDFPIYTKRLESIEDYLTNEREKVDWLVCIKKQKTNELLCLQKQWQLQEDYNREHQKNQQHEAEIRQLDQQIRIVKQRLYAGWQIRAQNQVSGEATSTVGSE